MIKVRAKVKDRKITVPVPYFVINLAMAVVSSKRFNRFVNSAIEKNGEKFQLPQIEKTDLKPLLHGLSACKGLVLVETKLKDGTEVTVKL